jgi:cell shape-determining protein MreC
MEVSDARKLKALEDENRRLKKLLDLRELVQMYVEARGASPRTCGR